MKTPVVIGIKRNVSLYSDAAVTKVHEDSYDIRLANGEIYKFVPNISHTKFETQDYVAIMFSDEKRIECRIIGIGKRFSNVNQIKRVEV